MILGGILFLIFGIWNTFFPQFTRGQFNQKLQFTKTGLLFARIIGVFCLFLGSIWIIFGLFPELGK